ncbi:MAG: hypothetical protein VX642_14530 [Bdellovibrionota bacterium]|nr:hypothetical protein [Bdellovibrionota bacterium]
MKNNLVLLLFLLAPALASAKLTNKQKEQLKIKALNKKPKPMFLLKKATEDLGVEEPKQEFSKRQVATVISDDRFFVEFDTKD